MATLAETLLNEFGYGPKEPNPSGDYQSISVPYDLIRHVAYPHGDELARGGNDPVLGDWKLNWDSPVKRNHVRSEPDDNTVVVSVPGGSLRDPWEIRYTSENEAVVKRFMGQAQDASVRHNDQGAIRNQALDKASELWLSKGPFQVSEIGTEEQLIIQALRSRNFVSRTLQLSDPITIWFLR